MIGVSELLELLQKRKRLSEEEQEVREQAEQYISDTLQDSSYVSESVEVVSSYFEFSVVMTHSIGIKSLDELDDLFSDFYVSAVHAVEEDGRSLLQVHFKEDDGDIGG